jgi:hypothetical protein
MYLLGLKRIRSERNVCLDREDVPISDAFLAIVKESAVRFSELIPKPSDGAVTRFVGNALFRCTNGFPSFRGQSGEVWVSRRDVNKEGIGKSDFIPVRLCGDVVEYGVVGQTQEAKPSVDAAIHCELYRMYPSINYILHGHVYLVGEKTTQNAIPCGAMQEVKEIFHSMPNFSHLYFLLNLKGHGFIACSDKIGRLRNLKFVQRPIPECQQI